MFVIHRDFSRGDSNEWAKALVCSMDRQRVLSQAAFVEYRLSERRAPTSEHGPRRNLNTAGERVKQIIRVSVVELAMLGRERSCKWWYAAD